MKKHVLLAKMLMIMAFTGLLSWASLSSVYAQCDYTFRMYDDFGDGWDGSEMIVVQNATTIATLTGPAAGGPDDVIVAMALDTPFELTWNVIGSWTGEKGIDVLDQNGDIVYAMPFGSGALAGTTIFSSVSLSNISVVPSSFEIISRTSTSLLICDFFVLTLDLGLSFIFFLLGFFLLLKSSTITSLSGVSSFFILSSSVNFINI